MNLRDEIAAAFEGRAFLSPLFYSNPGGLRFELSEGGTEITGFLVAMQKATTICCDVFDGSDSLVACLRTRTNGSRFAHKRQLSELKAAAISIPRDRCLWVEPVASDEQGDEDPADQWLTLAFRASTSLVPNLLWCALSSDFGAIRPRPNCMVYLFNLEKGLEVLPYDDRGMDVVGPNHELLSKLYRKHAAFLLDFDRKAMDASFTTPWNGA